jgi:phage N-6-adenine-methyltransferase
VNTALMFSTGTDDWQTPPELFAALDAEFDFWVDVAASSQNTLCQMYYDVETNALSKDWAKACSWLGERELVACWCNPPYSRGLQAQFIAKAAAERLKGVTTVMLLPARTDTKAFHAHIWDADKHQPREGVEVRFLKGRLRFVGAASSAPFPSMIVVFRGSEHLEAIAEILSSSEGKARNSAPETSSLLGDPSA